MNIGLRAKAVCVLILHITLNLSVAVGKSHLHVNSLCRAWRYFCVQYTMRLLEGVVLVMSVKIREEKLDSWQAMDEVLSQNV